MRVGTLLAILWCFSVQANAAPIWTYDLEGTVSGSEEAAGYLADIGVGDSFSIRMSMQKQLDGSHKINFRGSLGGWLFTRQEASAYYLHSDSAPERFYSSGSSSLLNAPAGTLGAIDPLDIYIQLFGLETTGAVDIAEKDRLIKAHGWLDAEQFLSGKLSFNFFAQLGLDGTAWAEDDLVGNITSIVEVSEPESLLLFLIGLLGLWARKIRKTTKLDVD
ncbi:PEP-CTERM sorting domain-containing protein [Marinobacter salarius]|uniref:PEP-CTERM sorting domain-containing protein n=1 Tax=Marinobacter salarius TaxID=1420917 RepID=UPI003D0F2C80